MNVGISQLVTGFVCPVKGLSVDVGISQLVKGFLCPVDHKGLSMDVGISKGIFMPC